MKKRQIEILQDFIDAKNNQIEQLQLELSKEKEKNAKALELCKNEIKEYLIHLHNRRNDNLMINIYDNVISLIDTCIGGKK